MKQRVSGIFHCSLSNPWHHVTRCNGPGGILNDTYLFLRFSFAFLLKAQKSKNKSTRGTTTATPFMPSVARHRHMFNPQMHTRLQIESSGTAATTASGAPGSPPCPEDGRRRSPPPCNILRGQRHTKEAQVERAPATIPVAGAASNARRGR